MGKYSTKDIINEWARFYFKAETIYDIHSPFMYDVIKSIENKECEKHEDFLNIQSLHKKLKANTLLIPVIDYGAGSRKNKQVIRSLASFAKTAASDYKSGKLLFNLSNHFQPEHTLELGTNLGIGTAYLASGIQSGHVSSIEGNPHLAEIARNNIEFLGLTNTDIHIGKFSEVLPTILHKSKPLNLVFIDGHHDGKATLDYIQTIRPFLAVDAVIILDDVYWSSDMQETFQQLIEEKWISTYIDLFYKGILFLDRGLSQTKGLTYVSYRLKPWRLGIWGGKS